ncbi:MAG: hypothetical protein ABIK92_01385 [Pseudomonadota bacterium]
MVNRAGQPTMLAWLILLISLGLPLVIIWFFRIDYYMCLSQSYCKFPPFLGSGVYVLLTLFVFPVFFVGFGYFYIKNYFKENIKLAINLLFLVYVSVLTAFLPIILDKIYNRKLADVAAAHDRYLTEIGERALLSKPENRLAPSKFEPPYIIFHDVLYYVKPMSGEFATSIRVIDSMNGESFVKKLDKDIIRSIIIGKLTYRDMPKIDYRTIFVVNYEKWTAGKATVRGGGYYAGDLNAYSLDARVHVVDTLTNNRVILPVSVEGNVPKGNASNSFVSNTTVIGNRPNMQRIEQYIHSLVKRHSQKKNK